MDLSPLITRLTGWAVSLFYEVERSGPPIPAGPVLVVANHPNALVDPLVVFHTARRPVRPLAKAPLFEQTMVGIMLRGLGGLPVFRKQDDPDQLHRNQDTFAAAVQALLEGGAVQIYPEGQSHSEPSLAPLRTGAARIALQAEEAAGWKLGLQIQPVGLTYTRKHLFRGRVVAAYGTPFTVAAHRTADGSESRDAVRALTDRMRAALEELTLNVGDARDRAVVEIAERLWVSEEGSAGYRAEAPLSERLPRLQRFAEGVAWLHANDLKTYERLASRLERYERLRTLFGAREGDVPPRYTVTSVVGWLLGRGLWVLLGMPAGLAGMLFWALPYLAVRYLTPRFRPKLDQIATYKLGLSMIAFPTWLLLVSAALWWRAGAAWGVVALLGAPLLGLITLAWGDQGRRVREDLRVWARSVRRPTWRAWMAAERAHLVEVFEEIARRAATPASP